MPKLGFGDYYSGISGLGRTTRQKSEDELKSALRQAERNISEEERRKKRVADEIFRSTPIQPTPEQLQKLQSGGVEVPSIFSQKPASDGLVSPQQGVPAPALGGPPTAAQPPVASPVPQMGVGGIDAQTGQEIRPMTPEEIARQDEIRKKIESNIAMGGERYTPEEQRRIQQEKNIADAKAGIGAQAMIKSIGDKTGMTKEEIGKAIGWEPGSSMSRQEALRKLKSFNSARKKTEDSSPRAAREIEEITKKAERDENGIAANDAARFEDIDSALNVPGADPLSEDPLRNSMTPSQEREYELLRNKVSSDRARGNDFKKMEKFVEDIQRKDRQRFELKQAKEAKEAINAAKKVAKDKAQRELVNNAKDEFDRITKLLKEYEDYSERDLKKEGLADKVKEYRDRRMKILDNMKNFQSQTPKPDDDGSGFVVGKTYQDANGNQKTYLGNGKWE